MEYFCSGLKYLLMSKDKRLEQEVFILTFEAG